MFDGFQSAMGTDDMQRQEAVSLLSQSTVDHELRSTLLQCFRCATTLFEDNLLLGDFCSFAFYGGFAAHSPELNSDGKVSRRIVLAIFEFAARGQSKLPVHGFVTAVAHLQCALQQAAQKSLGSPWVAQTKTVTSSVLQALPALKLYVLERTQCFPFPEAFYDNCSLLMRTMWKYSEGVELVFSHYAPEGVMNYDEYDRFCGDFSIFPHINRQTMKKIFDVSTRNNLKDTKEVLNIDCFFECLARIACALLFTDTFSQYVTTVSKIVNFFETTFASAFTAIFNIPLPSETDELPDPILHEISPSHINSETRRIVLKGKFLGALGRGIWVSHSLASSVLHVTDVAEDTAVVEISPLPLRAWDACVLVSRIDGDGIPVFSISYRHQVRVCVGNTPEDLALKCATRADLCTLTSDEISLTLSSATNEIARKRFTEACARVPYNQNFLYENCWRHLCDTSNMTAIGMENRVALGLSASAMEGKTHKEILMSMFSTYAIVRTGDSTGRGSLTLLKFCEMIVRIALCSAPPVGEIDRVVRDLLVYKTAPDPNEGMDIELPMFAASRRSVVSMSINSPSQQQHGENKSVQQMIQQQRALRSLLEKHQTEDREMREHLRTSVARLKGLLEVVLPAPDSLSTTVQAKLPAGVGGKLSAMYRSEIIGACDSVCSYLIKNPGEADMVTLESESMKSAVLGVLVDWEAVYRSKEQTTSPGAASQRIQKLLQFRDDQSKIEEVREQLTETMRALQDKEAGMASLQAMYVNATQEKEEKSREIDRLKLLIASQKSAMNDLQQNIVNERTSFELKLRNIQSENDRLVRVQRVMDDMQKKKKEDLAKVADADFKRVVGGLDESALRIKCFELRQQLGQEMKLQEIAKDTLEATKQREVSAADEIKRLHARIQTLEEEKRTIYQQFESGAESSQIASNRKAGKRRQSDEQEGWGSTVEVGPEGGFAVGDVSAPSGKTRGSISSAARLLPTRIPAAKKSNSFAAAASAARAFGTPRKVDNNKESPRVKPTIQLTSGGNSEQVPEATTPPVTQTVPEIAAIVATNDPHDLETAEIASRRDGHGTENVEIATSVEPVGHADGENNPTPRRRAETQVPGHRQGNQVPVHPTVGQTDVQQPPAHHVAPRRQSSKVTVIDSGAPTTPITPMKPAGYGKIGETKEATSAGDLPTPQQQRRSLTDSPTNIRWTTSVIIGSREDSRGDLRLNREALDSFASTTSRSSVDSTADSAPFNFEAPLGGMVPGHRYTSDPALVPAARTHQQTTHRSSAAPCYKCAGYIKSLRLLSSHVRTKLRDLRGMCVSISKAVRTGNEALGQEASAWMSILTADEDEDEEEEDKTEADSGQTDQLKEGDDGVNSDEAVNIPTASSKSTKVPREGGPDRSPQRSRKRELFPAVKSLQSLIDGGSPLGSRRLQSMRSKLAQLDEIMKRELPAEELAPSEAAGSGYIMIQPEIVRCVSPRIPLPLIGPTKADLIESFKPPQHTADDSLALKGVSCQRKGGQLVTSRVRSAPSDDHVTQMDPEPLKVMSPAELGNEIEYRVIFRSADGTVVSVDRNTYRGALPPRVADEGNKRHNDHQFAIREPVEEERMKSPIPRFSSRFEELLHLLVQESALRSVASGSGQPLMTPFSARDELGLKPQRPETARAPVDAAARVKASRLVVHSPSKPLSEQTPSLCAQVTMSSKRPARIKIDDSKLQHMRDVANKSHSTAVV